MGYGKLKLDLTYSANADYTPDELPDIAALTFTASKHLVMKGIALTDASQANTIDLVTFTTVKYVIVHNTGTTNECYVTWAPASVVGGGAVSTQATSVAAESVLIIPGVTVTNDLVLDCASGETTTADVYVLGT